ncbi:dTDP-4-amino-4,6-dideoxygalactose transaminase [Devosia crocina]|uniref:dTDP-4-amino-4,6-dideoxygalactose transaminase n=1 Tax=Devosia crocina TaxID=429728 RepID=A0A1I7MZA3_9HYPH|nr:DegT/DnrJ/EryC1/StrS family aminotransferase [Devosia crocina]SFV27739.1 dTDP-4-amino-4,6-dideoxygalactose transaminase [Devosia crocina]
MIPLLDIQAQYKQIGAEIEASVVDVLRSGRYILGEAVEAFEHDFAAFCGTRHAIAVNTGTSALHLSLLAAGIGRGDEVITTPFTFVATVAAILYAGARPVLVDIDPLTMNLDPAKVEAAISPATKAIIPVHLYGQMCDMVPLLKLADRFGLVVIEDACQAHGAEYNGSRAGSLGLAGAFSFYPGKNLGACGEGGVLVTNNDTVAKAARCLRDWGQEERYNHIAQGFNYRMDAIQGAVLGVKLRYLEDWTEQRRQHAAHYDRLLSGIETIELPHVAARRRHVYHVYAIRSPTRSRLREDLAAQGVQTGLHYPIPVHLQRAYANLGYKRGDFPLAEEAAQQVLSLPIYPELTPRQVEAVASAISSDVHVH